MVYCTLARTLWLGVSPPLNCLSRRTYFVAIASHYSGSLLLAVCCSISAVLSLRGVSEVQHGKLSRPNAAYVTGNAPRKL